MKALIIVDVQNDFAPAARCRCRRAIEVVEVINRIQPRFDLVVATQDWHPADHGSFAANHPGRRPGEQIELAGLPQNPLAGPLRPRHGRGRAASRARPLAYFPRVPQRHRSER